MNRKNLLIGAGVLAGVFLLGFLPQFIRAHRLSGELDEARSQLQLNRVKDLLGMTFLQVSQKNYGLAKGSASALFDEARSLSGRVSSADVNQALQKILDSRDEITAQLARGDPASYGLIQQLYQSLLDASNPLQRSPGA